MCVRVCEHVPGQMMRVLSTGRFSLLVLKGMEKEPHDWLLRLIRVSGGEHGVCAAKKKNRHTVSSQDPRSFPRSNAVHRGPRPDCKSGNTKTPQISTELISNHSCLTPRPFSFTDEVL